MYDLLLDYGCYCECCHGIQLDIQNVQGLTPLALAAKLAKKEVKYVLTTCSGINFIEFLQICPLSKDCVTVLCHSLANQNMCFNR